MKVVAVKKEYHGYIRLYPNTPDNCDKIARALAKECNHKEVSINGCEQSFSSRNKLEGALRSALKSQSIEMLNDDFYSFAFGEIKDFEKLPDDYYGF